MSDHAAHDYRHPQGAKAQPVGGERERDLVHDFERAINDRMLVSIFSPNKAKLDARIAETRSALRAALLRSSEPARVDVEACRKEIVQLYKHPEWLGYSESLNDGIDAILRRHLSESDRHAQPTPSEGP